MAANRRLRVSVWAAVFVFSLATGAATYTLSRTSFSLFDSVALSGETSLILKGGDSLKAAVPRGVSTQFRFVNPDGGEATMTWNW